MRLKGLKKWVRSNAREDERTVHSEMCLRWKVGDDERFLGVVESVGVGGVTTDGAKDSEGVCSFTKEFSCKLRDLSGFTTEMKCSCCPPNSSNRSPTACYNISNGE